VRLPAEALALGALLACAPVGAGPAAAPGPPTPAAAGASIDAGEVGAAVAKLRADPSLPGEKKIRSLRWTAAASRPPQQEPASWLIGLFDYLGETASLLLWVVGAIAVALAVIWAYRTFKTRGGEPAASAAPAVVQVGLMDIRPESLPEDIGAAALVLIDAGKVREALSLLYRGALSRAVHRFGVPIGESYTEGEALRAVGARLDARRTAYFADLVGLWRRAVYAGEAVPREPIGHLCRGFAQALDAAAP
jgi:hypothetical protein